MNPNLKTAIVQFIADEYKQNPDDLSEETNLTLDLGLTPAQITDLFQRLQDALNIILPEEKISQITTLGDIYTALETEETDPVSEIP